MYIKADTHLNNVPAGAEIMSKDFRHQLDAIDGVYFKWIQNLVKIGLSLSDELLFIEDSLGGDSMSYEYSNGREDSFGDISYGSDYYNAVNYLLDEIDIFVEFIEDDFPYEDAILGYTKFYNNNMETIQEDLWNTFESVAVDAYNIVGDLNDKSDYDEFMDAGEKLASLVKSGKTVLENAAKKARKELVDQQIEMLSDFEESGQLVMRSYAPYRNVVDTMKRIASLLDHTKSRLSVASIKEVPDILGATNTHLLQMSPIVESVLPADQVEQLHRQIDDFDDIKSLTEATLKDARTIGFRVDGLQDALLNVSNAKNYWVKQLAPKRSKSIVSNPKAVPSYRYKVGQLVKANGKSGKVMGVRREGGNGAQLVQVRTFHNDKTKEYRLSELIKD